MQVEEKDKGGSGIGKPIVDSERAQKLGGFKFSKNLL
jgi:hypothetical protein